MVDCASFVIMRELRIDEALTFDSDFVQALLRTWAYSGVGLDKARGGLYALTAPTRAAYGPLNRPIP